MLLIFCSSDINSFVLLDGMGKAYRTMDSPVGGDLRTIGSILSPTVLALCFPFGLGDNGEWSNYFYDTVLKLF
jgi:hypothetical protein